MGTCRNVGNVFLVLLLSSLPALADTGACTKSFDGPAFLKAAAAHGLALHSPERCLTTEMQNNTFFAPPDKDCKLIMPNANWLGDGFSFRTIQASGRFEAESKPDGIHITVLAAGGMKFNSVAVAASDPSCGAMSLEDVFIGAVRDRPGQFRCRSAECFGRR